MSSSLDFSNEELDFQNFDETARARARERPDDVVLSYTSPDSDSSFVDFSWGRIERVTRAVACVYAKTFAQLGDAKYGEARRAAPDGLVVALIGPSGPEHNLSFLALQRLGLTAMLISPRLADQGIAHLLRQVDCGIAVAAGPALEATTRVRDSLGVHVAVVPLLDLDAMLQLDAEVAAPGSDAARFALPALTTADPLIIMHTGGTTGLPKPVRWPHRWSGGNIGGNGSLKIDPVQPLLATVPIFHAFGMGILLQALSRSMSIVMMTPTRPVTVEAIWAALDAKQCQKLSTVPYVLKFFADTPGGLERLAKLRVVQTGGSKVPDDLAARLLHAGVPLSSGYGQTESGVLMFHKPDGDEWNWLTPIPQAVPYLYFEPVPDRGEGLHHLVCLPGLPSLVMSDRPDGSYGTKDLFERHPTDPTRWRFVARYDDIIVLINGEKADPHPLEQAVSRNPLVQVAVAFGSGRDALGIIVIPSEDAAGLSRDELVRRIQPDLDAGNLRVPAYGRVSPDAIIVKPVGTPFPLTDKSTVIRPRFLSMFAADIDEYYAARERAQQGELPDMSDDEVHDAVRQVVLRELGRGRDGDTSDGNAAPLPTDDADFFAEGMDSLLATNVRASIIRTIPLGGKKLATNVVFDHSTVTKLTQHLINVRNGTDAAADAAAQEQSQSVEALAHELVKKYSNFVAAAPGTMPAPTTGFVVILTGATGFLGRQILQDLVRRDSVSTVYCLVRAATHTAAAKRIIAALDDNKILSSLSDSQRGKIVSLACDLTEPDLGLPAADFERLRSTATHMVHNAWAVNFNMTLASFERHSIAGTLNLLNLVLSSPFKPKPAFTFVSSVASVVRARPLPIRETRYPFSAAAPQGYGQSKWVAERIIAAAAETQQLPCRIVRASQLSGDTVAGQWNAAEAVPRTVQTAVTVGALPAPEKGSATDTCFWLPADVAGAAVAELTLLDGVAPEQAAQLPDYAIFHIESTQPISWSAEFLPALAKHGLRFETVDRLEWVRRLEASDPDVRRNPPYRLLEHFKIRYGRAEAPSSAPGSGGNGDGDGDGLLDVTQALKYAPSLARGARVDEALMGRYLDYWQQVWADEKVVAEKAAESGGMNGVKST